MVITGNYAARNARCTYFATQRTRQRPAGWCQRWTLKLRVGNSAGNSDVSGILTHTAHVSQVSEAPTAHAPDVTGWDHAARSKEAAKDKAGSMRAVKGRVVSALHPHTGPCLAGV